MEKISGILPASSRVSSVDMSKEAPVRPGAPGFGRRAGVSAGADLAEPTTGQVAQQIFDKQMRERSQTDKRSLLIQNMADQFFMRNDDAPVDFNHDGYRPAPRVPGMDRRVSALDVNPSVYAPTAQFEFASDRATPIDSLVSEGTAAVPPMDPDQLIKGGQLDVAV